MADVVINHVLKTVLILRVQLLMDHASALKDIMGNSAKAHA